MEQQGHEGAVEQDTTQETASEQAPNAQGDGDGGQQQEQQEAKTE